MENTLFYGDNLSLLRGRDGQRRQHFADESVDLIYLDPPFNSSRSYNMIFADERGDVSPAQIEAFEDTWNWASAVDTFHATMRDNDVSLDTKTALEAFKVLLRTSEMMAYVAMMTPRLVELYRVLKPTGSLYLHCDPVASPYLRVLLDTIFGGANFRSEVVWRRTNSHNKTTRQYGPIHDTLLFYTKSDTFTFHPEHRPYSKGYIEDRFTRTDERGRFQTNYLTGPGVRYGESGQLWRGFDPTTARRHWAIPRSLRGFLPSEGKGMTSHQQLECLYAQDLILFPKKIGGQPMYKQYVGPGVPYQDIWAYQPNTRGVLFDTDECIDEDVKYLEDDDERLGYETQKPLGLLKRILLTSTNPGDVVLDPFCGCGTAIYAAQELGRTWLGIDITCLATNLIKNTLLRYRLAPGRDYRVIGEPRDLQSARNLISTDAKRRQFEYWALGLIGARPWGGKQKEGADGGRDGVFYFEDDRVRHGIVSVKSGGVSVRDVRELSDVTRKERADIGVLITMEGPGDPMIEWAADAGHYDSPLKKESVHRIQILSIADLLEKKKAVQLPRGSFLIAAEEPKQAREPKPKQEELLPLEVTSVTPKEASRTRPANKPQGIPPGQQVMVPVIGLPPSSGDGGDADHQAAQLPTSRAAKKKRTG